jgi:hypothetical protein
MNLRLLSAALLITVWSFLPAPLDAAPENGTAPPPFNGTWKWTFTMPDGSKLEPRVKLRQDGARLTGTARFRADTDVEIRNGVIQGSQVSFQVVRERDGQIVTTTYRGKLGGETIKGTIESDWSGTKKTYPWEATLTSANVSGTWQWKAWFGWDRIEMTLKLTQHGEKLSGKLNAQGRRAIDIQDAKIHKGEISFKSERQSGVSFYKGKIEGDTIKGTIETGTGETRRTLDWEAQRVVDEKESDPDS